MQNVGKIEYVSIAKMIRFVLNIISSVEAHSTANIQDLVNQLNFSVNAYLPPGNFERSILPNSLMYTSGLFSNIECVNHGKLSFSESQSVFLMLWY